MPGKNFCFPFVGMRSKPHQKDNKAKISIMLKIGMVRIKHVSLHAIHRH